MSNHPDLTSAIMHRVVAFEHHRLTHILRIALPALVSALFLFVIALYQVLRQIPDQITNISLQNLETSTLLNYPVLVISTIWATWEKQFLFALTVALTAIIYLIAKFDLLSLPFRFKEINRYKLSHHIQ